MEAIEAVVALVKERDELLDDLETYESWFEDLVGHTGTLTRKSKKKTKFFDVTITEFTEGEGWTAVDNDTDEVYVVTFDDIIQGRITFASS